VEPPAQGVVNFIPLSVGVDLVGDGCNQAQQELARNGIGGFLVQFNEGELRGAVDGDEHVQLAQFGTHSAKSMWK
jgi:hypothetical protein